MFQKHGKPGNGRQRHTTQHFSSPETLQTLRHSCHQSQETVVTPVDRLKEAFSSCQMTWSERVAVDSRLETSIQVEIYSVSFTRILSTDPPCKGRRSTSVSSFAVLPRRISRPCDALMLVTDLKEFERTRSCWCIMLSSFPRSCR
jgi:hypothetical protein